MSLREITKDLHHEAETTKFAKLLLSGKITPTIEDESILFDLLGSCLKPRALIEARTRARVCSETE